MNRTLTYSKNFFNKIDELWRNQTLLAYLIAGTLVTLPLKHIVGSLACIAFLLVVFFKAKKANFVISNFLLLPIFLYVLMLLSLIWTIETKFTIKGLQKEVLFLLIPLAFLGLSKINRSTIEKVFQTYSFAMVGYAVFYLVKAVFKFLQSGKKEVFFYHELVTLEVNAIYIAVFASLAIFFFLSKKNKSFFDFTGLFILSILILLLSSKNIILVDIALVIIYFFFFSNLSKKIKTGIILAISFLAIIIFLLVKPIRERFMIEFETVLVDSSLNKTNNQNEESVFNISLRQAWNQDQFQHNDFFPGTAFRVYQIRIFKEMIQEENIFFTGFGLDAAQNKIREKAKQHNLHKSYGELNFHNEYIQIFSELGIFGFLIVISMLFITIKKGILNKDFVHIAFAVTMIVLFLTESFLSRQRGIIFFIIIYCMLNTSNNCNEQKI